MNAHTPSTDTGGDHRRQRKSHQKSRNGCERCKVRHRKCDEVHPNCGFCRRAGVTCSLASPSLAPQAVGKSDERRPLAIDDMRLLFQWLKGDGVFFEDHDSRASKQERDHQMEMALAHPYLLHTILSIAALELFHNEPENLAYYEQASSHHLAALRYGRPNITQCTPEHSEPLWCFSAFTSLYSFAEPPLRKLAPQHQSSFDCLHDLLSAFQMGRGIVAVMASNQHNLGNVDEENNRKWPDETDEVLPTLDADFPQNQQILTLIEDNWDEVAVQQVRQDVVKLFAIMSLLRRRPKKHSSARLIQTWAIHADEALYKRWEMRDPVGLIILAHYAVLVAMRANIWFFERWPRLIIEYVQAELSPQWQQYVVWPQQHVMMT